MLTPPIEDPENSPRHAGPPVDLSKRRKLDESCSTMSPSFWLSAVSGESIFTVTSKSPAAMDCIRRGLTSGGGGPRVV